MKEIFEKIKVPIILVAVLFGGFILYNNFIKVTPKSNALLQKNDTTSTGVKSPEQELLPLLLRIQNVTLDEKLFLDPVFRALVDFSQPIIPENTGKNNPFNGALSGVLNSSLESLGFVDGSSTTTVVPRGTVQSGSVRR